MAQAKAAADTEAAAKKKQEHKELLVHHMTKLRQKLGEVNELRAPLKVAQEEFTALINAAKSDLGKSYTRKYLVSLLEDATSRLRDLLREEERRAQDREALGLPVFGVQGELFATEGMPDEAKDEIAWEAEGYMRGRNGLLEAIPEGSPPRFHPAILRGFERGQKATQEDFLAGQKVSEALSAPKVDEPPKDLAATDERTDGEKIDDQAEALKRSGFTKKSGGARQPEAVH